MCTVSSLCLPALIFLPGLMTWSSSPSNLLSRRRLRPVISFSYKIIYLQHLYLFDYHFTVLKFNIIEGNHTSRLLLYWGILPLKVRVLSEVEFFLLKIVLQEKVVVILNNFFFHKINFFLGCRYLIFPIWIILHLLLLPVHSWFILEVQFISHLLDILLIIGLLLLLVLFGSLLYLPNVPEEFKMHHRESLLHYRYTIWSDEAHNEAFKNNNVLFSSIDI